MPFKKSKERHFETAREGGSHTTYILHYLNTQQLARGKALQTGGYCSLAFPVFHTHAHTHTHTHTQTHTPHKDPWPLYLKLQYLPHTTLTSSLALFFF